MSCARKPRARAVATGVGEGVRLLFPLLLVLGLAALSLSLLNLVPSLFQKEGPRSYSTVREAEQALGMKILLPAYFPDYLSWPPAEIRGLRTPQPWVDLKFLSRAGGVEVLWIREERSGTGEGVSGLKLSTVVVERNPVAIGGASGWHVVLRDVKGNYYNQVYWNQGSLSLSLTTVYPWEELKRMAGSMSP